MEDIKVFARVEYQNSNGVHTVTWGYVYPQDWPGWQADAIESDFHEARILNKYALANIFAGNVDRRFDAYRHVKVLWIKYNGYLIRPIQGGKKGYTITQLKDGGRGNCTMVSEGGTMLKMGALS